MAFHHVIRHNKQRKENRLDIDGHLTKRDDAQCGRQEWLRQQQPNRVGDFQIDNLQLCRCGDMSNASPQWHENILDAENDGKQPGNGVVSLSMVVFVKTRPSLPLRFDGRDEPFAPPLSSKSAEKQTAPNPSRVSDEPNFPRSFEAIRDSQRHWRHLSNFGKSCTLPLRI